MSTMPFGKYKGWKLWNLPDDYLEWLIDNDICKYDPLRSNVQNEWDERQASRRRHKNQYNQQEEYHYNENHQSASAMSARERELVLAVIDSGYRTMSKKCHPDVGGSHEDMVALNRAIQRIRLLIG